MANEVLGKIDCETCDGSADVMQARRKGAHLYTRCGSCGLDQRTGAAVQNRLFYRSIWIDRPPPIPVNAGEPPAVSEVGESVDQVSEPETEKLTETQPKPDRKKSVKSGRWGWLVAVFGVVGVALAVVLGGQGKELIKESVGGGDGFRWQ